MQSLVNHVRWSFQTSCEGLKADRQLLRALTYVLNDSGVNQVMSGSHKVVG